MAKSWHEYLVALEPIRPDLYRYCRQLTGNVWDAEDLVQETLLRVFASLSQTLHTVHQPRAYLLRAATNLWIDFARRRATEQRAGRDLALAETGPDEPRDVTDAELHEAATSLLALSAPQERAAVLLKDVFDLSLEETARVLGTSIGAVKAALHRGRARLEELRSEPPPARDRAPSELVRRFVSEYNARNLPGLLALMSDSGTIDLRSVEIESGRESYGRERGWFYHNLHSPFDGGSPSHAAWESAVFEGEEIVLVVVEGGAGADRVVTSVMRLEGTSRIDRVSAYAFCPDVVREVAESLGLACRTIGYHFPLDVSAFE